MRYERGARTEFGETTILSPALSLGTPVDGIVSLGLFEDVVVRGAIGDGTTDDSAAIQEAIDAAEVSGGAVYFPIGVYLINTGLQAVLSNNLGINFVGAGFGSVLKAGGAITMFEVDLGTSNYQGAVIENLRFDLNAKDATAILMNGAGQHSTLQKLWMHNNSGSATKAFIKLDADSHSLSIRDVRIKGESASGDGVEVIPNIVTIDALDVTGVRHCVKVPAASNITSLTIQNSRLDDSVSAFFIDGAAARSVNFIHNRCENNSGPHLDLTGFDATTNKIVGLTVDDNYFTGMDSAAQDGVKLFRIDSVSIKRNHFKGASASAECVVFTSGVSNVSLDENSVDGPAVTMPGISAVPLPYNNVTYTQSSSIVGAGSDVRVAGDIFPEADINNDQDIVFNVDSNRLSAGGVSTRLRTRNTAGSSVARLDITGAHDIARCRIVNARLDQDSTALVTGDFALSGGWGTTASVGSLSGTDQRAKFTVTSAGTGQGANPTITLTFTDGTWLAAPFALVSRNGGNQAAVLPTWTTTTSTLVITFPGTPVAAETYTLEFIVLG